MLYGESIMLKICTVFFEGKYHPNSVSQLYRSLKENSSVPFEFICLADRGVDADIVLPYYKHSNVKLHWHKLKFFSEQFAYQKPGDDIIIMDIDQKIVGNVDEILSWPVKHGELLTYENWWNSKPNPYAEREPLPINGGFYNFKSGSFNYIWDIFSLNPDYWQLYYYNKGDVHFKYYGEQNYVYWRLHDHNVKINYLPAEWVVKYTQSNTENKELNKMYSKKFNTDYMILDKPNEKIKIIHYLGPKNK